MATEFQPKQLKHAKTLETPGALFALCRNGNNVYGAGLKGAVYRVTLDAKERDAKEKTPKPEPFGSRHENYISSLLCVNGTLISGGFDRRLMWTDIKTGKRLRSVDDAHDGWIRDVAPFPDGKRMASVGDDMRVILRDAATGRVLQTFEGHKKQTPQGYATALYAVAVSPDGKRIASGDRVGDVCLWDVETGKLIRRLQAPSFYTYDSVKRTRSIGGIRSLCFSPDGKRLAISGIGQVTNVDGFVGPCRVEVWDWQQPERTFTGQDGHKAVLNHVLYDSTGQWLIAGGGGDSGGILAIWNEKDKSPVHKHKPKGHLHRFCLTEDGSIITAGYGGFQIWRAKSE